MTTAVRLGHDVYNLFFFPLKMPQEEFQTQRQEQSNYKVVDYNLLYRSFPPPAVEELKTKDTTVWEFAPTERFEINTCYFVWRVRPLLRILV